EIVSAPTACPGSFQEVKLDVRLASTVDWGEVRLVLRAPSQEVWWQDLGGHALAGLAANTFHTLTFSVPGSVTSALAGGWSDLEVRVIFNAPSGSYLLDHLVFSGDGAGAPATPASPTLSLTYPREVPLEQVALAASHGIRIGDRTVLSAGGPAWLTNTTEGEV